jgi:acylphosphatase
MGTPDDGSSARGGGIRRVRARVSGRVQGVFFRATCAERARALGLAGWVRNAPGGVVEAEFEGPVASVESILAWCRQGPPLASVDRVDVEDRPLQGQRDFRISR